MSNKQMDEKQRNEACDELLYRLEEWSSDRLYDWLTSDEGAELVAKAAGWPVKTETSLSPLTGRPEEQTVVVWRSAWRKLPS